MSDQTNDYNDKMAQKERKNGIDLPNNKIYCESLYINHHVKLLFFH